MSTYTKWGDAAFAVNLNGTSFAGVGGYAGGPLAFHQWAAADWAMFPGYRIPIWVGGDPGQGIAEGKACAEALADLGVPQGCRVALDIEARHNAQYVGNFGGVMQQAGYLTETYGSLDTVFLVPPLHGYWVADYTPDMRAIERLLEHPHVRAVQYATNSLYDTSLRKPWTQGEMWHG